MEKRLAAKTSRFSFQAERFKPGRTNPGKGL
jgi:hypothetical protein